MPKINLFAILLSFNVISLAAKEYSWEEIDPQHQNLPNKEDIQGKKILEHLEEILDCARNQYPECNKGYIFYGPPGTGKTTIAYVAASELNATCISLNGSDVQGKIMSSGVDKISEMFKRAKELAQFGKVIIFIDEIDAIAIKPTSDLHQEERKVVDKLLIEICQLQPNIQLIGATNSKLYLEPALFRKGRLKIMEAPLPDEADRLSILKAKLKKYKNYDVNVQQALENQLKKIAKQTKDFNGATLNALVQRTVRFSEGKAITQQALQKAFEITNKEHIAYQELVNSKTQRDTAKDELEAQQLKNLKYNNSWWSSAHQVAVTAIGGVIAAGAQVGAEFVKEAIKNRNK